MLTAGCPAAETFDKRAVIITQYLGAGAKSTEKDIKHSLSWWGISKIGMFTGALSSNIIWNKLSEKRRKDLSKNNYRACRKVFENKLCQTCANGSENENKVGLLPTYAKENL